MKKRTLEKDMSMMQQLGMVTFQNVIKALIDNAIDFQVFTRETDGFIVKEIGRLPVDFYDFPIDSITFRLFKYSETHIRIYSDDYPDDDNANVEDYYCYTGLEVILNAIMKYVKRKREAV